MGQIKLLYEGELCTLFEHPESGVKFRTNFCKRREEKEKEFSPTDLFASSLGACVLTIMGALAEKLGEEFKGAEAIVLKEMSSSSPRRIVRLSVQVTCPFAFSEEIQKKLEEGAEGCPVHHSLHSDIKVDYQFKWES